MVSGMPASRLEVKGNVWRLAVHVAEGRPDVDLSASEIRLQLHEASSQNAQQVLLPVPIEAQPLDLENAKCSFSSKRGELFVEWPHKKSTDALFTEAETTASESDSEGKVASESGTDAQAGELGDAIVEAETRSMNVAEQAPSGSVDPIIADDSSSTLEAHNVMQVDGSVTGEEWKRRGNEAVKSGNFEQAIDFYSAGLAAGDGDEAMLRSNRAHCYCQIGRHEEGFEDASRCVVLRPDFFKGYMRGAKALRALGRFEEALAFLKRCPANDEAAALASELRPEAEAAEAARIAALDGCERGKEEGNVLFRKGLFEAAAAKYSEALEACEDQESSLILALRNNRAACFHQLSDYHSVLRDASYVLERDPSNFKALTRRMLALEPLERYEAALQDARSLLRQDPRNETANKVQHRLSKLVRDLQRSSSTSPN
mmetsp:Transcript_84205/g.133003  ORF Transcript_84205/g.133003 Transcript_84205/m.133003 type:complete len:430 (-) Transcript_84205:141-1430(-)